MMSNSEHKRLKELAWKKALDAEEQAKLNEFIAQHPEYREDLELELALTRSLKNLPDAPVSSNFTARVMNSIAAEEPLSLSIPDYITNLVFQLSRTILPKLAAALALILLIGLSYFSYKEAQKARIAEKLVDLDRIAMIDGKSSILTVDVFKDFDVIQKIKGDASYVDVELLTALKTN